MNLKDPIIGNILQTQMLHPYLLDAKNVIKVEEIKYKLITCYEQYADE
jgi:hypothetical protein